MSKAVIAQLEGSSLTADELERLRAFIRSEKHSTLGMLLQRLIEVHQDGITLHFISDDAELSPNQAAKLLKMSRPHLLKFMKDGDLPYHHVGSHKRITMSDLRRFMEARKTGTEIVAQAINSTRESAPVNPSPEVEAELSDL